MSSEAQKKAYKKYNRKKLTFAVVYTPIDAVDGRKLKAYLEETKQSANSYIKSLIKQDLDNKGFVFIATEQTEEENKEE